MMAGLPTGPAVFPLDLLDMLDHAWREISSAYDVTVDPVDVNAFFEHVDLAAPRQAAQAMVANMLSEVTECVGRFSPWYKQPAEAFGLTLIHDTKTDHHQWGLSLDAARRWETLIKALAFAIEKNIGLILASDLLGDTAGMTASDHTRIMACCVCMPPRVILVDRSVLARTEIVCDTCRQPFRTIDAPPGSSVGVI